MFRVRAIQAEFGDCFFLEYGTPASPRRILVDGGPPFTFERHLLPELEAVAGAGGGLDLVMLSHVDNDHVVGLLDLMARLRQDEANGNPPLIEVAGLWHNSFAQALDPGGALEPRLRAAAAGAAAVQSAFAVQGIGEGHALRIAAAALGLPLNVGFANDLVCTDAQAQPSVLGNLTMRVVGPTQTNLTELRNEWEGWLDDHEEAVASGDPFVMANSDRSIPNLSSIMVLAEADGKRALCTGDGRSDHLLQGLGQAGLLDAQGTCHVDLLKVPHHGSDRNVTRTFFRRVTADIYLISANGKDDNPDTATLEWIVGEAEKQGREIEIVATNDTPSTKKLRQELPPTEHGYRLTLLPPGEHAIAIELA